MPVIRSSEISIVSPQEISSSGTISARSRAMSLFVVFSVMVVFLTAGVLTFFGIDIGGPVRNERRQLADLPRPSVANILDASYFRDVETFLKDRLFGRLWLIHGYGSLVGTWRKDLVYGRDGFVFYRIAVEPYVRTNLAKPIAPLQTGLERIARAAVARGKTVYLEIFCNKAFVYPDKLPLIWQRYVTLDRKQMPLNRVGRALQDQGLVQVVDHTNAILQVRQSRQVAFTPVEENHTAPEANFVAMKEVLAAVAQNSGRAVELPSTFPSVTRPSIVGGSGYINAHYLVPNIPDPSGLRREPRKSMPGGWLYVYENPKPDESLLPYTVVYSDSFFETLLDTFGGIFLPKFRAMHHHWGDDGLEGWDNAQVVIISFADQTALQVAPWFFNRLADNIERHEQQRREGLN